MKTFRTIFYAIITCLLIHPVSLWAVSWPPIPAPPEGLVLSSSEYADRIGQGILKKGGNAVDAAVAVGFALAVTLPEAGNIGGGGFATIHLADGTDTTLDFREKAPLKATRDMYLNAAGEVDGEVSQIGHLSAGVPGTVAGLCALRDRYGSLPLKTLMAPAIELAEEGYVVNEFQAWIMKPEAKRFGSFPASRKYFLKADGTTYAGGEKLVQKDLAKTLSQIADNGPDAFYKGPIADLIALDMAANGGIISKEDLAAYKPIWRDPVTGTYRGYKILSMGPPSSGGIHIVQILNTIENADVKALGFASSDGVHVLAEAMRHAYADRSEYLGDPDFVKVPIARLTSKDYAKSIYDRIADNPGATPSSQVRPGLGQIKEGSNTTHYSVVDAKGNAVAITYTINAWFGSRAAVEGAGFLLNDEMDDFVAKPGVPNMYGLVGGDANSIEPEKRPLSSMSPTIVLKDGKVFLVTGSPGGSRIITTTLQTIINTIDHGFNVSEAVAAPRVHMQWIPDVLRVEPNGLAKDVSDKLTRMGYKISVQEYMGDVNAIFIDPRTGRITGSKDGRRQWVFD